MPQTDPEDRAHSVDMNGETPTGATESTGSPLDDQVPELQAELESDEASTEQIDNDDLDNDELEYRTKKSTSPYPLFCLHCNRVENHLTKYKNRWYYSFLIGLTFGLIYLFGPYKCRCCGHSRLMAADFLNPKVLYRYHTYNQNSSRT